MKINGKITILLDEKGMRIEVRDADSGIKFLIVGLTPKQATQAMGRLANTECENCEVYNLDKVGKVLELKQHTFELVGDINYQSRDEVAYFFAKQTCPKGWEPDRYFRSQNSFFSENGRNYARCTIRRWVDKSEGAE